MKKGLIEEYNQFYRAKPNKWASDARNSFCQQAITETLGHAPENVLDIGCGVGHTIDYLRQHWPETSFVGLDPSDVGIEISKKRVPIAEFIQGELGQTKFDQTFECVILLGVLEHIRNTKQALEQLKSLLATGGIVYIEIPNCIAYPESEHTEGFRRTAIGNHQIEWHRHRETWEKFFDDAGYKTVLSLKGPMIAAEFCWVLSLDSPASPISGVIDVPATPENIEAARNFAHATGQSFQQA